MIRINLLPVRVSKKKAAGKQQLILFAVVIVAGYVGNFIWAKARADVLAAAQARVAKTKSEIGQLDRIIGEVKNIKDQQAALREKLDILNELKSGRTGPVRVLDALGTLTPKRLWLTKIEEKGGVLTFAGQAATIDDVSAFMSALKGNPHFGTVELAKTAAVAQSKAGVDLVEFALNAQVRYSSKKETPADSAAKPGAKPAANPR